MGYKRYAMTTWPIIVIFVFKFIFKVQALGAADVVFVVLSQSNEHHARLALQKKEDIIRQADELGKGISHVHLSHVDFPHVGGWTITPLIPRLAAAHADNSSVIFIIEERTRVDLPELLKLLEDYDGQEKFVGFALHDDEPSIIHHFAFYNDPTSFKYPNVASGFAITTPLLLRLNERLLLATPKTDFNIDVSHELALFISDEGEGTMLTHDARLCIEEGPKCATYPEPSISCGHPVPNESVYFAVKTCEKFHNDRVPVVKNSWGRHANHLTFYSDVEDKEIPTVTLGIPNTEQGHCEKTFSIMRRVQSEISSTSTVRWIVIADDDTILSVSGLRQLLSCYDPSGLVALGERYGYGTRGPEGYNYITGGGGMVISRPLLTLLADPGNCDCPTASTPDDMYLGFCLRELRVDVTHSPLFHQARPGDYATGYLKSHHAVSFHKHWMLDPLKVYRTWFADADAALHTRTEL